ncbi:MAG: hypothetical protein LC116_08195, partial [Bacteroidetes bacterium]|nr:hypothetical protein [Bacteroidota bacterium]
IYQKDSIVVIKNENGIVTTFAMFELDTADFRRIDTMLGMQFLSSSEKYNIMKIYFSKFGATIDTSDKKTVKITSEFRIRVTSEGIQDFFNSGNNLSRPFTLVKYSSNVGDKYEFTDMDNKKITREVVYKSTDNDYEIGFFRIKVMKIDEIEDDPMYKKITYVANHKYGLVGIIITLNNNKTVTLSLSPANM